MMWSLCFFLSFIVTLVSYAQAFFIHPSYSKISNHHWADHGGHDFGDSYYSYSHYPKAGEQCRPGYGYRKSNLPEWYRYYEARNNGGPPLRPANPKQFIQRGIWYW